MLIKARFTACVMQCTYVIFQLILKLSYFGTYKPQTTQGRLVLETTFSLLIFIKYFHRYDKLWDDECLTGTQNNYKVTLYCS